MSTKKIIKNNKEEKVNKIKRQKIIKNNKEEKINKIKRQKINKNKKLKKSSLIEIIKTKISKKNIFYLVLLILDIVIIIYSARHNYANYVSIEGINPTFIGDTKDLFFGKNYITLITTAFFFIYICLTNKFLFQGKNTKKFILSTLIFISMLNLLLFFIFTKRVY